MGEAVSLWPHPVAGGTLGARDLVRDHRNQTQLLFSDRSLGGRTCYGHRDSFNCHHSLFNLLIYLNTCKISHPPTLLAPSGNKTSFIF